MAALAEHITLFSIAGMDAMRSIAALQELMPHVPSGAASVVERASRLERLSDLAAAANYNGWHA